MIRISKHEKARGQPQIIYYNQTGYVKDRCIGDTVRSILDIMDFTNKGDIPGLLIFIDSEKAFNSLESNFPFSHGKKLGDLCFKFSFSSTDLQIMPHNL